MCTEGIDSCVQSHLSQIHSHYAFCNDWLGRQITFLTKQASRSFQDTFDYWNKFFFREQLQAQDGLTIMSELPPELQGITLGHYLNEPIVVNFALPAHALPEIFKGNNVLISTILRNVNGDLDALDPTLENAIEAVASTITELDLQKCEITDDSLLQITAMFSNLTRLNLESCPHITARGIRYLKNVTNLNLRSCRGLISSRSLHLPKGLVTLNLSGIGFDFTQIRAFITPLAALRDLDISNSRINNGELRQLAQQNPLLTRLKLSNCNHLTHDGLAGLAPSLEALTTLNLAHCWWLNNEGLQHLSSLKSLTQLTLTNCRSLTDDGLAHIFTLTLLVRLNLAHCKFTDNCLAHIIAIPNLIKLNLRSTSITDNGMAHLVRQRPNLVIKYPYDGISWVMRKIFFQL